MRASPTSPPSAKLDCSPFCGLFASFTLIDTGGLGLEECCHRRNIYMSSVWKKLWRYGMTKDIPKITKSVQLLCTCKVQYLMTLLRGTMGWKNVVTDRVPIGMSRKDCRVHEAPMSKKGCDLYVLVI